MMYAEADPEWKKITIHCENMEEFRSFSMFFRKEIEKGKRLGGRKENVEEKANDRVVQVQAE